MFSRRRILEETGVQPAGSLSLGAAEGVSTGDSRFGHARKFRLDGGGGGSRTRVRRHVPEGLYMRVRFFNLVPVV